MAWKKADGWYVKADEAMAAAIKPKYVVMTADIVSEKIFIFGPFDDIDLAEKYTKLFVYHAWVEPLIEPLLEKVKNVNV